MIINNTHQFVFIHIPRTGGTSISHMLSAYSRWNDIELGATDLGHVVSPIYHKRYGIAKHSTYEELYHCIGKTKFDGYFKFAFVRHPVERAISTFKILKYQWRNWDQSDIMDGFHSFNEFVLSDFFLSAGPHNILNPQWTWICDQAFTPQVDFIGKLENLQQDYNFVLKSIGLPAVNNTLEINASDKALSHETIKHYNRGEVLERIFQKYRIDLRVFDYDPSR